MLHGILNIDKRLKTTIPVPLYEYNKFVMISDSGNYFKWANGDIVTSGVATHSKDYGIAVSGNIEFYNNKIKSITIQHKANNTYGIPDTNEIDILDLSAHVFLNTLLLQSPFVNGANIIFPKLVSPLTTFSLVDNLSGYSGENSITGVLDLTPLNANNMFGGTIFIQDKPDLTDVIFPTTVSQNINISSYNLPSETGGTPMDMSGWSRFTGFNNFTSANKSDIIFPTFIEPGTPPISYLGINPNFFDIAQDRTLDLSGLSNLGGNLFFVQAGFNNVIFPPTVPNTVTRLSFENNPNLGLGGPLDLSIFTDFNGNLDLRNCGLTSLTLPPSVSTSFTEVDITTNDLDFTVNNLLDFTGYTFNNNARIASDFSTPSNNPSLGATALVIDGPQQPNIGTIDIAYHNFTSMDFSGFTNPSGVNLKCDHNPNLTNISMGSIIIAQNLGLEDNDITGHLDLSNNTCSGKVIFNAGNNANLNQLSLPTNMTATNLLDRFSIYQTGINHTVDLSDPITTPKYQIFCSNITGPNFNILLPPDGSNVIITSGPQIFYFDGISSTAFTDLNLSGYSSFPENIRCYNCPNLQTLTFSTANYGIIDGNGNSGTLYAYDNPLLQVPDFTKFANANSLAKQIILNDNNWTAAQVNECLVLLAGVSRVNTSKTLQLVGTNAAPDATSGGFDGLAAITTLTSNNWVVTTN